MNKVQVHSLQEKFSWLSLLLLHNNSRTKTKGINRDTPSVNGFYQSYNYSDYYPTKWTTLIGIKKYYKNTRAMF